MLLQLLVSLLVISSFESVEGSVRFFPSDSSSRQLSSGGKNRRLDTSEKCLNETEAFADINVLLDEYFDFTIDFDHNFDDFCISNESATKTESFCDLDEFSSLTAKYCEDFGGDLYTLTLTGTMICNSDIDAEPIMWVEDTNANANFCFGKSCDINNIIENWMEELESYHIDDSCEFSIDWESAEEGIILEKRTKFSDEVEDTFFRESKSSDVDQFETKALFPDDLEEKSFEDSKSSDIDQFETTKALSPDELERTLLEESKSSDIDQFETKVVATNMVSLWVDNYGYSAGNWRVDKHPRFLADVNGDGRADIVGFGNAGAYVSLSTGYGFTEPSIWVDNYGYSAGNWRVDKHPRFLADVNGDGRDDIVGFGNAGAYVSLSTGYSFSAPTIWVDNYGYSAGNWRVDQHPRFLTDVNGDGRADIVGFGNAGAYVSLSTGYGFTEPSVWVDNYGYSAGNWRVDKHPRFLSDVNGDGRADIVGFGNAGAYVSLSTGHDFTPPSVWVDNYGYSAGNWRVDQHPRFLTDVNGDGHADIVGFGNAGAYVSLSALTSPSVWVANYGYSAGNWREDKHPRFLADVNGDGRDDIVGFGSAGTYVSLSTGYGFSAPSIWVSNYGFYAGNWRVDKHPRFLADVNGDGRADIVGFGNAGVYVTTL